MPLERWQYRDPAEIVERMESRTCKGCIFERQAFGVKYCDKSREHGKRCSQYKSEYGG